MPFSGTGGSEDGGLGGLWSGGDPIVTDGQGDFYFMTGNGIFDQNSTNFPNPTPSPQATKTRACRSTAITAIRS